MPTQWKSMSWCYRPTCCYQLYWSNWILCIPGLLQEYTILWCLSRVRINSSWDEILVLDTATELWPPRQTGNRHPRSSIAFLRQWDIICYCQMLCFYFIGLLLSFCRNQGLSLQQSLYQPTKSMIMTSRMIASPTVPPDQTSTGIDILLDQLHSSAANANKDTYFYCFSAEGCFLGTDPLENWHVDEFHEYAQPAFESGKGWTYSCVSRSVTIYDNTIACFDETLISQQFGHARGTGTLRLESAGWKILQYHLSFPIPNELAVTVTDMVWTHYGKKELLS